MSLPSSDPPTNQRIGTVLRIALSLHFFCLSKKICLLENDANGFYQSPSPEHGFKSDSQFVRIVTHNFPERFAIVAKPREEKFVVFNEAGAFNSSILPNAQVFFGENTLNTSRNISLQV